MELSYQDVVVTVYAMCLTADGEPLPELVDAVVVAIEQDALLANKAQALEALFDGMEAQISGHLKSASLHRVRQSAFIAGMKQSVCAESWANVELGLGNIKKVALRAGASVVADLSGRLLDALQESSPMASGAAVHIESITTRAKKEGRVEFVDSDAVIDAEFSETVATESAYESSLEPELEAEPMQVAMPAHDLVVANKRSESSSPTMATAGSASPASIPTLGAFLRGHRMLCRSFDKVFVAPNIPMKKLEGALQNYGRGITREEVLALVDDTVFGGAKEGALVTSGLVRCKAIFTDPVVIDLAELPRIRTEKNRVYVGGSEIFRFNIPEAHEVDALFTALEEYLVLAAAGSPQTLGPAPAQTSVNQTSPEPSAGERAFMGSEKGFYRDLARQFRNELDNLPAGRSDNDVEARRTLQLIVRILDLSESFGDYAAAQVPGLKAVDRLLLSSDVVRFEVMVYVLTLAGHLLGTESGFDDDQVGEFIAPLMMALLLPYVVEVERLGERRTLKNLSNPLSAIRDSAVFEYYRRRAARYADVLSRDAEMLNDAFRSYMCGPCAPEGYEPITAVQIQSYCSDVMGSILTRDIAFEFLRRASAGTELALIEYFDD